MARETFAIGSPLPARVSIGAVAQRAVWPRGTESKGSNKATREGPRAAAALNRTTAEAAVVVDQQLCDIAERRAGLETALPEANRGLMAFDSGTVTAEE